MKSVAPLALALTALLFAPAPAQAQDVKKLKKKIQYGVKTKNEEVLAEAIGELAQLDSKKAVDYILMGAVNVQTAKVLVAASDALAAMTGSGATGAICDHLEKKGGNEAIKVLCIDSLEGREDKRSGKILGDVVGNKRSSPSMLRAALAVISKRKPRESVDGLIDRWAMLKKRPDMFVQDQVDSALIAITGTYFKTEGQWRKFWDGERNSGRPISGGDAPKRDTTGTRKNKPPRFFGTEILSERIVFIIDTSGSMQGERLKKTKDQLIKIVNSLGKKSMFAVVGYSSSVKHLSKINPKRKTGTLMPASPGNKKKAVDFINGMQAAGTTHTLDALKHGYFYKDADTIVLLSDGVPTQNNNKGERITEQHIIDEVTATNKLKKWRINTFGFTSAGGQLEQFMKDLAKLGGGKFKAIQ